MKKEQREREAARKLVRDSNQANILQQELESKV
jgi:hypothetical protein